MQIAAGEITGIMRYPIKSFAGESLESCSVEPYGLAGDRFGAFYDEAKQGWKSYFTARTIPEMLTYHASIAGDELHVLSPEGQAFRWDDELLQDLQRRSGRRMSMTAYRAPNKENPDLMAVDAASILIVTDTARRNVEAAWGKELDVRRFRPNLVVAVNDEQFQDSDWIGKRLRIGSSELQVDSFCQRCSLITLDPDSRERDPSLLKTVNAEFGLNFGLYASVVQPGVVHLGDKIYVD